MCVLSRDDIRKLINYQEMIKPYSDKKLRYVNYDISVGNEYKLASQKNFIRLNKDESIEIPPYEICYILSEEEFKMPHDVCAIILSRNEFAKKGLLSYPLHPIDPGYEGKAYIMFHNLSGKTIKLKFGESMASVIFLKTSAPLNNAYGSSQDQDKYQKANSLQEFIGDLVFKSAFKELKIEVENKIKNWRERFFSVFLPWILLIITIILMIITILVSWKIIK